MNWKVLSNMNGFLMISKANAMALVYDATQTSDSNQS